jgi:ubiquinone/menaquinone biosynthesis C-methylase UbiE
MQNQILNFLGKSHAQYIHAKGVVGTSVLIKALDCQPNEKILEIGFGTGTTLVRLFSNYKQTKFYGIELSPLMYEKAKARLSFCLVGNSVRLNLIKDKNQITFDTNFFDKIFIESVLGIQEDDDIKNFLMEMRRVLKPNGLLIINETIWLDSTTPEEITRINDFCKQYFGIIQSSSNYPHLKDWINLFTNLNFKCESIIKLDELKDKIKYDFRFPYNLLSFAFTGVGKIKSLFYHSLRKEKEVFANKMKQIIPDNKQLMEGILFKVRNEKPEF